jgi:hypothetical protein
MEDINLQTEIDQNKVADLLGSLFPELTVFEYTFGSTQPAGLDLENPSHIFFHTVKKYANQSFDFELRIYRTPSACETERALFIAQKISSELFVPTLVRHSAFSLPDKETSLNNILFQDNKTFTVDENLSIEKECVLPNFAFDPKARYLRTGE